MRVRERCSTRDSTIFKQQFVYIQFLLLLLSSGGMYGLRACICGCERKWEKPKPKCWWFLPSLSHFHSNFMYENNHRQKFSLLSVSVLIKPESIFVWLNYLKINLAFRHPLSTLSPPLLSSSLFFSLFLALSLAYTSCQDRSGAAPLERQGKYWKQVSMSLWGIALEKEIYTNTIDSKIHDDAGGENGKTKIQFFKSSSRLKRTRLCAGWQ